MLSVTWDIRRDGRTWRGEEAGQRYALAPEKIEMVQGRLLCTDDERLTLLGLLLENLGADAAVRLGDPDIWRRNRQPAARIDPAWSPKPVPEAL